ncbi:MAG: 30S ribosomal protein S6 [Rhodospirillales bacterium RIFCSPLOWO2_12_FULL_58_28]|nr:MAG: 30S ribosomal protein S6 [Rhodospirillales bacterium RIFCSPLOWO2_02_FULL_58_16]OHC79565.1 MAG: 30S ribosomal protein S6 [Rhodospirillales bacterium RIFCSPLOWO2_12_FULL_58_28]
MAYYETVFIARQDISTAQVDALSDAFSKIIRDGGGKITKKEDWGLRSFAFRIKKSRKGYYVLLGIDAPCAAVHEMERQMRISEDVLRYLTLRLDEADNEPSVIMRNKGQSDERPRRPERDAEAGAGGGADSIPAMAEKAAVAAGASI